MPWLSVTLGWSYRLWGLGWGRAWTHLPRWAVGPGPAGPVPSMAGPKQGHRHHWGRGLSWVASEVWVGAAQAWPWFRQLLSVIPMLLPHSSCATLLPEVQRDPPSPAVSRQVMPFGAAERIKTACTKASTRGQGGQRPSGGASGRTGVDI